MNDGNQHRTRLSAAERKETILRAATEVFAQHGYRAAKVSDIAGQVGVTEPVVFQNYGSKAALFAAVLERAAADARSAIDALAGQAGSAADVLDHVLGGHPLGEQVLGTHVLDEHVLGGHAAYGVLFADAIALTAEPELTEPAQRAIRAIATHLADLIRRAEATGGVQPGSVQTGTDPDAAAWLLLSVLSARRLRDAAMPAGLETGVAALARRALTPQTGAAVTRPGPRRPPGHRPSTA